MKTDKMNKKNDSQKNAPAAGFAIPATLMASFLGLQLLELIGVLFVTGFSLSLAYNGLFVQQDFFLPTYDNSMLHAGRAREVIETGHWAEKELVFGGNTTSYHLPAHPVLVATVALATGLNWAWAVKLVALLMALLFPIAFYLLGKEASGGNWVAGVAAAFLALNSINLMEWGTRTTPISLGVVLVIFLLFFILKKMKWPALLCALAIALDHQPSLLAAVLTLLLYSAGVFFAEAFKLFFEERKRGLQSFLREAILRMDWNANATGLLAFFAYMSWHIRQTFPQLGWTCLNFHCLPQASAHEFGKSINLLEYFFKFPQAFAALGILAVALDQQIQERAKILLFAWLFAMLILVKNDEVFAFFGGNGGVFTERFLTYLDEAAAVFGGIAIGKIVALISGKKSRI